MNDTPITLEAIKAARAAITQSKWEPDFEGQFVTAEDKQMKVCDIRGWGYLIRCDGGVDYAERIQNANTEFIANAPAFIDWLVAEVERLSAETDVDRSEIDRQSVVIPRPGVDWSKSKPPSVDLFNQWQIDLCKAESDRDRLQAEVEALRAQNIAAINLRDAAVKERDALREAVRNVYYAAHWTPDRQCDAVMLWTELRDAAGFEQGQAPKPEKESVS
ncbi:MAG TPA: hypothetical protein VEF04_04725 [Blastocatellia bacterium]|nr:hypothetical protein [Blastocatellia bacterium]